MVPRKEDTNVIQYNFSESMIKSQDTKQPKRGKGDKKPKKVRKTKTSVHFFAKTSPNSNKKLFNNR
jgi:hypothetical protein